MPNPVPATPNLDRTRPRSATHVAQLAGALYPVRAAVHPPGRS